MSDALDLSTLGRSSDGAIPIRTCVGCRQRATKRELLRVVAVNGTVIPDPRARRPGRGAYLHSTPGCLDLAERRRALPRALRLEGPLDVNEIRALLDVTCG